MLRAHGVSLEGPRVLLRPLTEDDWETLLRWNNDPEVLYFSEGADVKGLSLEEIQHIYRSVSQSALCFIVEVAGRPIGECWLQVMNLKRILSHHPGQDCRRIDIMIGEKNLWGQGYGSEAIAVLTSYAFQTEGAELVFGCDISEDNPRSLRAFEKCGYIVHARTKSPAGAKAAVVIDMVARAPRRRGDRTRLVEGTG